MPDKNEHKADPWFSKGGLSPAIDDVDRLVRMFRCMPEKEQSQLLKQAAEMLMGRISVGPDVSDNDQQEEYERSTEHRLLELIPFGDDTPAGIIMTMLADPHMFVETCGPDFEHMLLGSSVNDDAAAESLLNAFIHSDDPDAKMGIETYLNQFHGDEDELLAMFKQAFPDLINAWRINLLTFLEHHSFRNIR